VTAAFSCLTCVFFVPNTWSDHPTKLGQCRRRSPVLDTSDPGHPRSLWPMVHHDAFCGEHATVAPEEGPEAEDDRPVAPSGWSWRCFNCKEIEVSPTEPDKCVACQCRTFAKVDQ
jgi:hypothetical protein